MAYFDHETCASSKKQWVSCKSVMTDDSAYHPRLFLRKISFAVFSTDKLLGVGTWSRHVQRKGQFEKTLLS